MTTMAEPADSTTATAVNSVSTTETAVTTVTVPGAAAGSVWRNPRLQILNLGAFAALTGVAVADVVYPLLVLGFTGKPILAGLFGAIQFTAMVLCSIPAGAFIDRHDRRRVLVTSEIVRALLATALAVSLAAGHVWLIEVYLVAMALGACQPFSSVRILALRGVVPAEQVTPALAAQQIFNGVAALLGPALGAMMFTLSRSLPFTVIAAGMGVSATCAYLVRFDSRPVADVPGSGSGDSDGPLAGLRIIWRSAVMRSTMLFITMINLIGVPLDLVIILEARHQGVPTRYLGAILACFAAGGILGAPLVPRVHALLRPGNVLAAFGAGAAAVIALLAAPFGGFWMAGCMLSIGLLLPAVEILVNVLILQQVPDHQRGRVMSATMTFMGLGTPLGAAFGGTVLQVLSPATVLIGAAALLGCVTLIAVSQPDLRAAQWPAGSSSDAAGS
ncbi:MFS transporter [Actinospica robiniae]|uniref:MFS transporter n=1 Tax=Actinospica robiniae TaxID=304901 RepID=UPI00054CE17E|nr:MFS transporter [Actinospica robiniae]